MEPIQFKFSSFFTRIPCSSSELASEVLELSGCTRRGSVSWCPSGERIGGTLEDMGGDSGVRQSMLDCLLKEVVKDAGVLGPLRKDSGDLAASAEMNETTFFVLYQHKRKTVSHNLLQVAHSVLLLLASIPLPLCSVILDVRLLFLPTW